MQNRVPVLRSERPDLPDFEPVPRKFNRHDGWTPARQKAFIEALADTGSVRRAAGLINMSQANVYALRRAPGAEGFRRAWDAALDFGLARLKDIAFERAIEGELVPVFNQGKLMGFLRKRNTALLIFCLRHYGQDASGKRTTINYFSTRASAGVGEAGGAGAAAQASTTTMRTVISGGEADTAHRQDDAAAMVEGFAGVQLDAEAEAAIAAVIADYAERRAAANAIIAEEGEDAMDILCNDRDVNYVPHTPGEICYRGTLEPPFEYEDWDESPALLDEHDPDRGALS
jgi:hypothetical protein